MTAYSWSSSAVNGVLEILEYIEESIHVAMHDNRHAKYMELPSFAEMSPALRCQVFKHISKNLQPCSQ